MVHELSALALDGIALQQRAADPQRSVWVSASAGSGKTRVLVDRTLRLMLSGTAPERILCITFTKAAAAEMANRLNTTLGDWSVMSGDALISALNELQGRPPEDAEIVRARRLFASVLDAPGGIKIQTIHSFCGSILGRFPLEAGITPNFQELDDRTAAEMMEVARDRLLMATRHDGQDELLDALDQVSQQVNEQDFSQLMQGLSSKRGRLKRFFQAHGGLNGAIAYLAMFIEIDPDLDEKTLVEQASDEGCFDGAALRQALEVLLEGSAADLKNAAAMEDWLRLPDQRISLFDTYLSAYFKKTDGSMKSVKTFATNPAVKKMGTIREVMTTEAERLETVIEKRRRIRVLAASSAILRLGQRLLDEYEAEKTRRGALDFDDLILTTRDLLTKTDVAPWVMFKLDGGIDHILVDEAQDTSPEQWEVINALTEEFFSGEGARDAGRTLFVVGDEKQSIYSFQGADPAAFDKMRALFEDKADFAKKAWEIVPLGLSFRSTHAVLSLVDDAFSDPAARAGLNVDGSEIQHFIFRDQQPGFTEIWPIIRPEEREETDPWEIPLDQGSNMVPAAELARNIAIQIKTWLETRETLASSGAQIKPSDVMILVQRRNAFFDEMVRALKLAQIPVAGADRMRLTEQLAVMDLVALGKFVLLPEDDLNLAVVLKGPFVGCDDDQLYQLAHKRGMSLWQALRMNKPGLPIFTKAVEFLRGQLARADFVPVYEFFAQILGRERGREKLLSRLGEEAIDPIEEFLSLALSYQRNEATSLQAFLHWLEVGGAEVKRDMEQGKNEVRVLTVHGSKGLQAPIVFLPDTCQGTANFRGTNIIWTEEDIPSPLWPVRRANYDTKTLSAYNAIIKRQEEEKRRLLYVAMTRAEDRLYICGWENVRRRPEGCWYDVVDKAFVEDHVHKVEEIELPWGHVARRRTSGDKEPKLLEKAEKPKIAAEPMPSWVMELPAEEPFPPQPLTPSKEEEEPSVRSPLGGDDGHRFHRGILIHRLLESLPAVDPEVREAVGRKWLSRPAHNLASHQQSVILQETLTVLQHPEFAGIFGPGSMAEVPLTGLLGNRVMSGQIDRLLIGEDEILVVDYKTNRPSPRDLKDVPAVYFRQMGIYREALKKIYPEKRIKCGLLWTDGPHLMEIPEN